MVPGTDQAESRLRWRPVDVPHLRPLSVVLLCAAMLMATTVSAPQTQGVSEDGAVAILPHAVLAGSKVVARGVALIVLVIVVWRTRVEQRYAQRVLGYACPWFLFGLWCLSSVTWSALPVETLFHGGSFCVLLCLAYAVARLCREESDLSTIFCWLSCSTLVLSSGLIVIHLAIPQVYALTKAALGIFHSTAACSMASLGILLVLAARLMWGWTWSRWLWLPSLLVQAYAMVLGNNRLSMALTVLIAGGVCLLYAHRGVLFSGVFAACVVGATYLIVDPGLCVARDRVGAISDQLFHHQSQHEIASLSGREEMWRAMRSSFFDAPWRGHSYFVSSRTGQLYVWQDWHNWPAHNLYLQLAVTTGLVGVALFTVSLGVLCAGLVRRLLHSTAQHREVIFCLLIALWFALWGVLNGAIFAVLQPTSVIFACVLGIGLATAAQGGRPASPCKGGRPASPSEGGRTASPCEGGRAASPCELPLGRH